MNTSHHKAFAASTAPTSRPRTMTVGEDLSHLETEEQAVEVAIYWGDDELLHLSHLSPLRDVFIGEGEGKTRPDYLVGAETLGIDRLPVVIYRNDTLYCVLPEGCEGEVSIAGESRPWAQLADAGALSDFDELPGARIYPLPAGATATIRHNDFSFVVRPTTLGKKIGADISSWGLRRQAWIGVSLAVHAAFLVMFYFMPPNSSALGLDRINAQSAMIEYATRAAAIEDEEPPPEFLESSPSEAAGGTGTRAAGESGDMGEEGEPETDRRYAVEGRADDPNPELARERVAESMESIGAIGALRALTGSWQQPTSPFGAAQAHGLDSMSAMGNLMGAQIGVSGGFGGLDVHGTGRGAGGLGEGTIGLGRLGTLGHGNGTGTGDGTGPGGGYGHTAGPLHGQRVSRGPTLRPGRPTVTGGLSAETIRRVVHRHLSEVRFCYEQGLQQNPSIEGRVTIAWVIGVSGAVQSSMVRNSQLHHSGVESCIASAVQRWSFPSPGGVVGVNYPFMLNSPD